MKASCENTTSPMRSYFRSPMNSATICFAAPSLLGAKSACPMLPEISSAMAMSTPSPRMTSLASLTCGLAAAIITSARATSFSAETNGMARRRSERLLAESGRLSAYLMPADPIRPLQTWGSAPNTGTANSINNSHGESKVNPFTAPLGFQQVPRR